MVFIFVFNKSTVPWKFMILFTPPEMNINNSKNAIKVMDKLFILVRYGILITNSYFIFTKSRKLI